MVATRRDDACTSLKEEGMEIFLMVGILIEALIYSCAAMATVWWVIYFCEGTE